MTTEKPTERRTWQIESLDTIEQLAIQIFSGIVRQYPEIGAAIVRADHESTKPFWEEVDGIIREALPGVDMVELERIQKAAQHNEQ